MKMMRWLVSMAVWLFVLANPASASADLTVSATLQTAGIRVGPLASLLNHVTNEQLDIRSLLLARNGQVAFEWHSALSSREHTHQVFSVTKSVVSLLLGQAVSLQSRFSLQSDVSSLFDAKPADPRVAQITLEHLLMMRSGLPKTRAPTPAFRRLHRAPDRVRHILALHSARPANTRFQYGNADSQLLAGAVKVISGMDLSSFAEKTLFGPLGFRHHHWMHADQKGLVAGGYGLRLRTIDMARLGQLALQGGVWNGQQLIPEAYLRRAISAGPDAFYGYQWWTQVSAGDYPSYAALGVRGQVIQVVPALKLVFVMTADLPKPQARPVRRTLVNNFVIPAADGGPEAPGAQQAYQRALQRATGYKPVSAGSQNLPEAAPANSQ